jgi:hypothetical protein
MYAAAGIDRLLLLGPGNIFTEVLGDTKRVLMGG